MKLKRIAAAAALSAAALSIMSMSASAYEHTAFLMFTDCSWLWSNWGAGGGTDASITGPGTYTVSLNSAQAESASSAANGANVFCVEIVDGYSDLSGFEVTLDSIKADGQDVNFDPAKICYGDLADNGTYRIEIHNAYGETGKMSSPKYGAIDNTGFTAVNKIEVTFTVKDPNAKASNPEPKPETVATTPAPIEEVIDENGKPNGDNPETKVSPTGNTSVLALLGVMSVSAAAAFAVKKSYKK